MSPRAGASGQEPSCTGQPFCASHCPLCSRCRCRPALAVQRRRARGPFPSRPESHHYAALAGAKQPSPNTSPEPLHCRQGNTPQ